MTEPAQAPNLKDLAIKVVRLILRVYDLFDQDEVEDNQEFDYRLNVKIENDQLMTVNIIVIDDETGRILAGRRKTNLQSMQKLLISAIHFRREDAPEEKLERYVRLSINGQFPKPENGDEERPVEKPVKKPVEKLENRVVTIIVPPGVEIRALNPDGTSR